MATAKGGSLSKRTGNKLHRKSLYVQQKKDSEKERRESRFRRKKEEAKDPEARRRRLERNKPLTIDRKRQFENANDDDDGLYSNVDLNQLLKRRRLAEVDVPGSPAGGAHEGADAEEAAEDDELDSMLGSDDEKDGAHESSDDGDETPMDPRRIIREDSAAPSMATTIDLAPESLVKKFPALFSDDGPAEPKTLITTSLHSTIHDKAQELVSFIPNSDYVPRSQHKYSHNYSVREIAKYATNRGYSTLVILGEDQKKPSSLNIVALPSGPTFTFSISNWMDVKKLPGHGNPQDFYPEILLNGFTTPLGILTARMLMSLWPKKPEFQGRQVVTFHNQRDYIFVRRHRYMFREKRGTEKSVEDSEGKVMKGVEDVRAVPQELGPRFTLKLRRIVKGIGRAGSEGDDAVQWQWKSKMDVKRTRFNL